MKEDAEALAWLGSCYECGTGVEQNLAKAAEFYRLSAAKGNVHGCRLYATACLHGSGRDTDIVEAKEWFLKAANKGCTISMAFLGSFYEEVLSFHRASLCLFLGLT